MAMQKQGLQLVSCTWTHGSSGMHGELMTCAPAQTRLHALAIADALFARSRAFRGHLAAQFPAFLELAVGHRPARPLPGPGRLATQLREAALGAVERWHDAHGAAHQQARWQACM